MRVIIAARLSRIAKGQTGIDTQDEDAREWAEEHGHTIVDTVADRKSGTVAMWNRKNLKPWVTEPDYMALYDGIVAAKQDRLSRADWSDEARIRLWAEEHGKKLFIVDRNLQWPPRDADDHERWNNGAEQARREWENTSKRYRRMQKALRDQGYFVGKRTYGYKIVGSGDHKTLEIDEYQAGIVREMARRYLAGESLRDIRDWLVAERVPVPQPDRDDDGNRIEDSKVWSSQAVRRILSNSVITGRVIVKGRTYTRVPHIIEEADFTKIREKLASKATRGPAAKDTAMLTSVLKCEDGHPMHRIKGRPVPSCPDGLYYYCNAELAPKGQRHLIPLTETDQVINGLVIYLYGDLPNLERKMKPAEEQTNEKARIKADLKELDPEQDDYLARVTALHAELAALGPSKPAEIKWVPDGRSVLQAWKSLDVAGKRAWLIEHGWRVISTRKPKAEGKGYDYGLDFSLIDPIPGLESVLGLPKGIFTRDLLKLVD